MAALEDAYITLVMSDNYLPGATVLAHSLRDAGTQKKLAVMITLDTVGADTVTELRNLYDYVITVSRIGNSNPRNLYLMDRGDLLYTFTKINLWRQTQFRKIVYIDADVVALRAVDELFDIDASFAAAPDAGWPDAFNSGVMVLTPNMGEYWALQTMAASGDSFDGADQGLLNQYFEHRPWQRLSFTYNCTPNAEYQWEPAYKYYKANIKMVHFIGKEKPWMKGRYSKSSKGIYNELHSRWWAVYDRHMKQTQDFVPGQAFAVPSVTIRQHVAGESQDAFAGVPQHAQLAPPSATDVAPNFPHMQSADAPEFPRTRTEAHFSEPGERSENFDQGLIQPTTTQEARRFSAPHMQWDATRSAPPPNARPEAANFPNQEYTFNLSKDLFKPPEAYPEPPKDMWYSLPPEPTTPKSKPKAIFPWEQETDRPQPTRVFADDLPPVAKPPSPPTLLLSPVHGPDEVIPSQQNPWETSLYQPFAPQANAWDNDKSIDRYVRAVVEARDRRNKVAGQQPTEEILSPTAGPTKEKSLKITDFPSFDDRPSLPVTPAPIRRSMFWGDERVEQGELPAAEGVPDQADWDPNTKLDELRRSSIVEVEHLKNVGAHSSISQRDMPEHASRLTAELEKIEEASSEGPESPPATGPQALNGADRAIMPTTARPIDFEVGNAGSTHPVSTATAMAELTGGATAVGAPEFEEPEFATIDEEDDTIGELRAPMPQRPARRVSPGSFSAESILASEHLSPTER